MALIQHWKLDDNAASTTVVATVGNTASLEGGGTTADKQAAGPGGSIPWAFGLNGASDAVDVSAAAFDTNGAFTISLWFRPSSLTNAFLLARAASAFRGVVVTTSTEIQVQTSSGGGVAFVTPTIATGAWRHLYVTRGSGAAIRLWLDGVESSSGALVNSGLLTFDRIGRRASGYFSGRVSQVRIWDTDESASVATWYAEGAAAGSSVLPRVQHHRRMMGIA